MRYSEQQREAHPAGLGAQQAELLACTPAAVLPHCACWANLAGNMAVCREEILHLRHLSGCPPKLNLLLGAAPLP